ncbi:uncharacterized protein BJ171DRAFT_489595 [Polychytrium aggregatum]|uniref:uncharacterized protein n=1 Tax=Polychytrium aggregatum TaxID=110093 RepID=UPI0022FEAA6F|nr:uncharacterized protein BJ171DRAFT_489595 [Polychytrium aggregatum]KAI9208659.1 hypothetical protein BJ171DRAFT_489595 [Polychytrium aggregatum]
MLHIDGQVRAEMTERFEHETAERTSEWEAQKAQELVLLKDRLTQEHETILQNTVFKMDAQRVEETDALKWDLSMAKEEWANKELEFDKQLAQLGTEKQMLYKELVDQRDNNIKRVAAIMDEHQQQLIDEKKAWDLEAQARETQLKVGHTLALSAVEKKYKVELEEVDKNNQKKIEEIKHANTAAAMTAKREAENQKQAELTKQRATHNAELDRMRDQHERDQMALRTSMEEQKTSEIADIRNKNSAAMEKKNAYIEQLTLEIANHQLEIKDLKQTIMELRYDIKQVEEQLAEKDRELQAAIADGKQRLKDLEAHMLAEKKDEIMKVNEEHVDEVKHMIREFEQAQNFLKKQIAQQAKQLQEADLRYINREPREVDLRHIAELEEEIKRRKKKISGLHDELDYYKLEMNNREASFNKIFNKTPLVGVMQPPTATPKGAKKTPGDKSDPRKERLPPLYLLSTTPPAGQAT